MTEFLVFTAPWCGPCKMYKPAFEECMKDNPDISYRIIDVDEEKELMDKYKIRGVPTTLVIKDDDVKETLVGAIAKSKISKLIDKYKETKIGIAV